MAHDHPPDPKTYYVEQMCMIGICGALGGVAVMLFVRNQYWFLVPNFKIAAFVGGIALLILVFLRGLALWLQAPKLAAQFKAQEHHHHHEHGPDCAHDHEKAAGSEGIVAAPSRGLTTTLPLAGAAGPAHVHGPDCDHDHGHGHGDDHGHGHGHEDDNDHGHGHGEGDHAHGWAPWRYVILLLPVVLYFLDLYNPAHAGVNQGDFAKLPGDISTENIEDRGEVPFGVGFKELGYAAYTPSSRKFYEGKRIEIIGEYGAGNNEKTCKLVRYRMVCCGNDALPLGAVIQIDSSSPAHLPGGLSGKWVRVTGQIQFLKNPNAQDNWVTVIVLNPKTQDDLKNYLTEVPRPADPYLN